MARRRPRRGLQCRSQRRTRDPGGETGRYHVNSIMRGDWMRMSKWLLAAGVFGFVLTAYAQQENGTKKPAAGDSVSFAKDVVPVIAKRCLPCHAEENFNPSELSLDSYDKLMAGGKHGVPVIAGNAKESI